MKVLITGAGGKLGHDVVGVAQDMRHQVVALGREDLDVSDPARVERVIARERPGAVINCAAWTNVDGAEESEHEASLVNAQGAGFVADAANGVGAKVVYISTDYVFGGSNGPYGESDDTSPINAYGRSKLAGERATALVNGRSFIVRTSWLFGPHGNFVETMLRLGQGGGPVVVVHDQVGCPTYTGHLAVGLLRLIDSASYGIHHMSGGKLLLVRVRAGDLPPSGGGHPGDGEHHRHDGAAREAPADSVLISRRSAPIKLPPWQRGLSDYLAAAASRAGGAAQEALERIPAPADAGLDEARARGAAGRGRGDRPGRTERAVENAGEGQDAA